MQERAGEAGEGTEVRQYVQPFQLVTQKSPFRPILFVVEAKNQFEGKKAYFSDWKSFFYLREKNWDSEMSEKKSEVVKWARKKQHLSDEFFFFSVRGPGKK